MSLSPATYTTCRLTPNQKDHIGILHATNEWPASFISIDGNTDGNLGANWALLVKGIGGGYVAQNRRFPKQVSKPITSYRPPYDVWTS